MYLSDPAEWLVFTYSSCAAVNVIAITIFSGSVGYERLKIGVLSKVFAMIRTHRDNKGSSVDASLPYRGNKSIQFLPFAMLVRVNVAGETFVQSVPLFARNC